MPIHKLKLLERKEVARGTLQFIFEKPSGFVFQPGQYGGFTLIDSGLEPGANTRRFSILSAPHDPHLAIATRIQSSSYKRVLNELKNGSEMKFAGPTGTFTLHADQNTPAVFIAGGIGITPFYSMIRHAVETHSNQKMYLFYGNQSRDDAAFLAELEKIAIIHPHFKLIATMANPDPTWNGETGFITYEMIKKHIPNISAPIYYVCGSPAMVNAMHEILNELEINEDRICTEDFPGY